MLEGVTQKTEIFTYPYLTGTSVNLCQWVLSSSVSVIVPVSYPLSGR